MLALSKEKLDESIGIMHRVTNQDFLDRFSVLAKTLKDEQAKGDNEIIQQALDCCVKFQNTYNPFVESMRGLLRDLKEVGEIAEYLEKQANIGSIGNHDATFKNQGISADDVRM